MSCQRPIVWTQLFKSGRWVFAPAERRVYRKREKNRIRGSGEPVPSFKPIVWTHFFHDTSPEEHRVYRRRPPAGGLGEVAEP